MRKSGVEKSAWPIRAAYENGGFCCALVVGGTKIGYVSLRRGAGRLLSPTVDELSLRGRAAGPGLERE
jgi:hypothetical protein